MEDKPSFRRRGSGKTLVLLHGFLGGAGVWALQENYLSDAFDLVCIDLPGFAGSTVLRAPTSVDGYASAVIARLDSLRVGQFSLLGWSFGGMVAQQMALEHSPRLDRLILYGTSATGDLPSRFETWDESARRIKAEGVEPTLARTVATWFVDGELNPFYSSCKKACSGTSLRACLAAIQAIRAWEATERISAIAVPTLVMVGDRDRSTTTSDSMVLWKSIPGASLCVLPGCAHGAHMQNPGLFNYIVRDFIVKGA